MLDPWVGKIPWRKEWLPTPVFLPGESHGQRNMLGYSSWGRKESDTTEWLIHTHARTHTHAHTHTHTHTVKQDLCSFCLKMIWKRKLVIWRIWSFLSWSPLLLPIFCALWPKRFLINLFCSLYWQSTSWFMPPMILSSSPCFLILPWGLLLF